MPNETPIQATAKEKARRKRVTERGETARSLIKYALDWKTDDQASWALATGLAECRNPKLLAAVWVELQYIDTKATDYGTRAQRVVLKATEALARDLV